MEFLFGILAWVVFAIYLSIHLRVKRKREEREYQRFFEDIADRSVVEAQVQRILTECYHSLTKQNAAAFGPWIPSLLDGGCDFTLYRDSQGRVHVERQHRTVSPEVALTAVRWTIAELSGGRFDLSTLYAAQRELLEMGA